MIKVRCCDDRDVFVPENCFRDKTHAVLYKDVIEIPFESAVVQIFVLLMKLNIGREPRLIVRRNKRKDWSYRFKMFVRKPKIVECLRDVKTRNKVLQFMEFVECKKTLLDLFVCIHMYYCLN